MKFLKIAGLVILALIVLVFLVGSLMPENYSGEVILTINRPPEEIWAQTQQFDKHPIGGKMTKSVQRMPDENGLPVWVEDLGDTKLIVKTLEAHPPSQWKLLCRDEVVSMTSESESHIEPAAGGSRIRGNYRVSLPLKTWHVPIFRIIMAMGGPKAGIRDYWSSVANTLSATLQVEK